MNILTFDIEDWFHINFDNGFNDEAKWNNFESRIDYNTNVLLDLLEEKQIKATFFSLGWVARKHPDLLKRMSKEGHDIGSHSDIHNLVHKLTKKEFIEDLKKSKVSIEDVIGKKVNMFRAPAFSIGRSNLWAFEVLSENGIEIDASVFPANHDFGGFEGLDIKEPFIINYAGKMIKEFPMSTANILNKKLVLTGGGFFRFFPYFLIKTFVKNSNYVITYFHPRDFDANQPILSDLSKIRKFKSYYGLKNSMKKFNKFINEFDFINISKYSDKYDWVNANKIDL